MSTERSKEDVWHAHVEMAKARGLTIPTRVDPADYGLLRELLGDDALNAMLAAEKPAGEAVSS